MNSEKSSDDMWEEIGINKELVMNALSLAKRDLKTARNVFEDKDYDWCLSIAYNAMLQSSRAIMFSRGYRPKGQYKHVAVVEFVKTKFGDEFTDQTLFMFNKIRKKRHTAVYEEAEIVSENEARNVLKLAERFIEKAGEIAEKQPHPP